MFSVFLIDNFIESLVILSASQQISSRQKKTTLYYRPIVAWENYVAIELAWIRPMLQKVIFFTADGEPKHTCYGRN